MALINYRPNEGKIARITGVVCLLALFLLGSYQLYGWLGSLFGAALGAEGEAITVELVDDLAERAGDIAIEKDRVGDNYIAYRAEQFSLAAGAIVPTPGKLYLESQEQLDALRTAIRQPGFETARALLQLDFIAPAGASMTSEDIRRITGSKQPPDTVTVLGDPRPQLISSLLEEIGDVLADVGAATPFEAELSPRQRAEFSLVRSTVGEVSSWISNLQLDDTKVELAEAIAEEPAFEAGTSLAQVKPELGSYKPEMAIALRPIEGEESVILPVNQVGDGSVLAKAIEEPTGMKLEQAITVDATTIVEAGAVITVEALEQMRAAGLLRTAVKIEELTLPTGEARGYRLLEDLEVPVGVGTRLSAELISKLDLAADAEVRLANVQKRLELPGNPEEARALLEGRELTAPKVLPREIVLVEAPENNVDSTTTVTDYWARLADFNKGHDERYQQSMNSRALRVRDKDPESLSITQSTEPAFLENRMLAADFTDPDSGEVVFSRGRVLDILDAQEVLYSITDEMTLSCWTVRTISEIELEAYDENEAGPDHQFEFREYTDAEGNVLLSAGFKATACELLEMPRIDDVRQAVIDSDKLLEVVTAEGGSAFRTVTFFEEECAKWQRILVLEEDIVVPVTEVVVEAGTIDEAGITRLQELPEDERWVVVRGECEGVVFGDVLPEVYEVCEQALRVTIPSGSDLKLADIELILAAGIEQVRLQGINRPFSVSEIEEQLGRGVEVRALAPITEGGTVLAEPGDELTRELLTRCQEEGMTDLVVSGTPVEKVLTDLEPGDVPHDILGVQIVEPLVIEDEEIGKNAEFDEDIAQSLEALRKEERLHYPIVLQSRETGGGSPQVIRIENDEDWGKIQEAMPVTYELAEAVDLSGPLAMPIFSIGTSYSANWAGILAIAFMVMVTLILMRLANHEKLSDLLIETESELRKVTWPTRQELIDSSQVVIFTVIVLMVFMFGADWFLGGIIDFLLLE